MSIFRWAIWFDLLCCTYPVFFFFKQKTAYEMRISDWSSDVCSSDLARKYVEGGTHRLAHGADRQCPFGRRSQPQYRLSLWLVSGAVDRKSVVSGKSVSVRVDLGGRRIIKKKNQLLTHRYRTYS